MVLRSASQGKLSQAFLFALLLILTVMGVDHARSDWKKEWERTLAAAEKEGQVTIYGQARKEVADAIQEFRNAYPRIKLNFVGGQGSDLGHRVMAEKRAGKHLVDVAVGGGATMIQVYHKADLLEPISTAFILPEVTDQSFWWGKKHHYSDSANRYVFMMQGDVSSGIGAYNIHFVQPGEIQSWWDLLNPKWKGKMVMTDPKSAGNIQSWVYLYHSPELGPKYLRRLIGEMDLTFSANEQQMVDWLAQGKFYIHLLSKDDNIEKARRQGLPVMSFDSQKEAGRVSSGSGHLSFFKNAPHPNAARVYINWILSREGQMAWQKYGLTNSFRIDIPKDMLQAGQVLKEGRQYFMSSRYVVDLKPLRQLINEILAETKR
ncbi:MAG: ABC transporter substrate-binding protein [Candidatus Binatia bacterium]